MSPARWPLTLLVCVLAMLLTASGARAEETSSFGKSFCAGVPVHDYERVLDQLPPVSHPPDSRDLPFGPRNMSLYQSALSRVIVGRGGFGYRFFDETYGARPEVRLSWDVTTTLSQIDRHGKTVRIVDSESQYLGVVRRVDDLGFFLETPMGPALYRYDIEFRDHGSDAVLGSYSEYLRVVKPRYHVRLALPRQLFAPGETAFARVENRGTEWASFGLAYAVQKFEEGTWRRYPERSTKFWPLVGLNMPGGESGWCMRFRIPADAEAGKYRFVKEIAPMDSNTHRRFYTAVFRVTG